MNNRLECPVDFVTVNENKVRLTALLVFILTVAYLFLQHWAIPAFLVADFFARGFHNGTYSPLGGLSEVLVKRLAVPVKPVDGAPKRFAAQAGFIFSDLLFIAAALHVSALCFYLTLPLLLFSFLEAFAGVCAGCYVYRFYKRFHFSSRQNSSAVLSES